MTRPTRAIGAPALCRCLPDERQCVIAGTTGGVLIVDLGDGSEPHLCHGGERVRRQRGPARGEGGRPSTGTTFVVYATDAMRQAASDAGLPLRTWATEHLDRAARGRRYTWGMQNKIAGSGQHSHPVPTVEGLIVEMRDGNHAGTSVWLSSAGDYVFACHEQRRVKRAKRCVLIRGLDIELTIDGEPCGCDLDSPDGLILVGLDADEPVPTSEGSEILWDSAAESK